MIGPMSRQAAINEPQLRVNPAADGDFRRDAEAALSESKTPAGLEALLRGRYPRAIVRVRELASETLSIWYVYREGHWVASDREVS